MGYLLGAKSHQKIDEIQDTIFDQFLEYFEDLESLKMVFSCRRGAIFEKSTFFRSDKVLDGFFHDFLWSWGSFR